MATKTDIIHGYRHLYRALLQAVQYQYPWRIVGRAGLRAAFREPGAAWDEEGARRTRWFLEAAAREAGLEHKVLKNLLRVRQDQLNAVRDWRGVVIDDWQKFPRQELQDAALKHFEMTLVMLNKSMGLRLR